MKFFKKEPENLIQILNEPLWLNKHTIANNQYLYDIIKILKRKAYLN